MCYTEEQIKQYLDILHNYTNKTDEDGDRKAKCWNCQRSDCFSFNTGYKICDSCGDSNGHVLGYYEQKDYDRLHFRKKSIYQRKYYYEKNVNQVSKRLQLAEEEKYGLYNKLMSINNHTMEILNKQFCRKRMISIFLSNQKIPGRKGK